MPAHLIGVDGLRKTTPLIGDARHVQHGPAAHHATRGDGCGLFGGVVADGTVNEQRMPGSGNLCGIANGVADIADLIFTVRIAIKRAVFGDIGIVQRVTGGLVSGERVQHGIAGRSLRQLVDDLLAFHQHLCGRIHEASENDMTLDLEIRECRGRARGVRGR